MSSTHISDVREFAVLTDHLPVMVAHCDRDLRFKYANKAYVARFDLPVDQIVGRHAREIIGDEAVNVITPYVARVLAGESLEYETWVPYRSLGRRYMRCVYRPEFDADGLVIGYVAGLFDETARKAAEEALTASRARLDFVAASADIGVWSCDLPFDELIWNAACKSHFGLSPSARVTIDTFYERMHPDDVSRTRAAIQRSIEQGTGYDIEYRTRQVDGSFRWIRAVGRAEYDERGAPTRFEGVTLDVTAAKLAQAALTDSRDRLLAALEAANTGTFRWDIDSNALDWDDNLDRLFGLVPGSTVRSLGEFLRLVHPDDRQRVIDACARCAAENADFVEEYRVIWPDGSIRWLFDKGRVHVGADGRRYMSGACVDVTERRQQEDALREADRQKDEFLGMLAHELRNPLAPITYAVSMLERAVQDPSLRRPIDVIGRQATRMVRIVDDLLDVSRVTQGKIALQRDTVSIDALLTQCLDAARPRFEARRHVVRLVGDGVRHAVVGDEVRLAQVFENLLVNAAKYTPEGGRIEVTVTTRGDWITVAIADTGIGIESHMLPRVFDLFTQAETSLDRAEGGLGIGLTLVDKLIRLHGGDVTVHSEGLGRGSTFTVKLPRADPPGAVTTERSEIGDTSQRRVLIVDDNVDSADMLRALLESWGHTVAAVYEGTRAVSAALEFRPDVILLDIGLPDKDGYRVAAELRAEPTLASAVLVAATGYGRSEDKTRCLASGFDDHITKPVDRDALRQVIAAQGVS